MSVYDYIANQNPYVAKEIINSFGYKVADSTNMGENLRLLVSEEGEPALKMILDNHPDKDVLLELNTPSKDTHIDCQCQSCRDKKLIESFVGVNGSTNTQSQMETKKEESLTPVVFLAGIMILAVTILSKNK